MTITKWRRYNDVKFVSAVPLKIARSVRSPRANSGEKHVSVLEMALFVRSGKIRPVEIADAIASSATRLGRPPYAKCPKCPQAIVLRTTAFIKPSSDKREKGNRPSSPTLWLQRFCHCEAFLYTAAQKINFRVKKRRVFVVFPPVSRTKKLKMPAIRRVASAKVHREAPEKKKLLPKAIQQAE